MTMSDFDTFFRDAEPRLRRAYGGRIAPYRVGDAVATALAHAWAHWDRVAAMEHPIAYLYRVGLSKSRRRKQGRLPATPARDIPAVEPDLIPAMQRLPRRQREVVWLVDACDWTPTEAAAALGISLSAARTHRTRGLERLRRHLGVTTNV